jgi:hypothetical protein
MAQRNLARKVPSRFKRVCTDVSGFLKDETFDRHLSRGLMARLIVANLPALPARAAHKFMLDFWQIRSPAASNRLTEKKARPTAKCNAAAATLVDPHCTKIPIKLAT